MYHNQIVHHKPCFYLFIPHNNLFDNQGSSPPFDHIKFYFSGKRQRKKKYKNLSKNVIENLFLLFQVIAPEHLGTQGTRTRKHAKHVGTWARKHAGHVGTWARKRAKHVDTWACKHARHVCTWTRKTRNLADSSVFQEIFTNTGKIFILGGGLCSRQYFYKVLRFFWYFPIS